MSEPHRKQVIRSFLPAGLDDLLDVGCGPLFPDYPYACSARSITCVDWKLKRIGETPPNIHGIDGDFLSLDLGRERFDAVIASDVLEHVAIEDEARFVAKCADLLRPGGCLIITVPHRGTFSFLDVYQAKPAAHRMLRRLGLYKATHNGFCDIRKGHKHYTIEELEALCSPLECVEKRYWGYFYEPLNTLAEAVNSKLGFAPGGRLIARKMADELARDHGDRSFNVGAKFVKPARPTP